jgi:hypothetical protein
MILTCWLIREADGSLCWWTRQEYECLRPAGSYVVSDSRRHARA